MIILAVVTTISCHPLLNELKYIWCETFFF